MTFSILFAIKGQNKISRPTVCSAAPIHQDFALVVDAKQFSETKNWSSTTIVRVVGIFVAVCIAALLLSILVVCNNIGVTFNVRFY